MKDVTSKKAKAALKMAVGGVRMGGAVATATGHGVIGGMLRQHHMMRAAVPLAKAGFLGGKRMFEDGLAEWKEAE